MTLDFLKNNLSYKKQHILTKDTFYRNILILNRLQSSFGQIFGSRIVSALGRNQRLQFKEVNACSNSGQVWASHTEKKM